MFRYLPIRSVTGREILDSRGNPTVEVEVAVGEWILGLEGQKSSGSALSGAGREKGCRSGQYRAGRCRCRRECARAGADRPYPVPGRRNRNKRKPRGKRHSRCLTCCGARGGKCASSAAVPVPATQAVCPCR